MTKAGESDQNPFLRYRHQLDVHDRALAAGWSDDRYVAEVAEADARLAAVAGTGFRITPLQLIDAPVDRSVWAKIETANVGGSHKARHLFGLSLHLLIESDDSSAAKPELAIASCGNAAVGAANVAKAADRALRVFVPDDADPAVMSELDRLGATVEVCSRRPGVDGDPCMHGLETAIASGARPFTVQGPTCPDVIDGGRTLGLELAEQLRDVDVAPSDIYIQIGGGALASATMDGLVRAEVEPLPRLHPTQPATAHPYLAAWERVLALLAQQSDPSGAVSSKAELHSIVDRHPEVMTPWPGTPSSVATGILDDITYDWVTVMHHQIATAGWPIAVEESVFVAATDLAATQVTPPPDATGAASLAGLLADPRGHESDGPVVVLITGIDRAVL